MIVKFDQLQSDEVGKLSHLLFELNVIYLFQPVSSKFFTNCSANVGNKIIHTLLQLYIQCGFLTSCSESAYDHFSGLKSNFHNLESEVLHALNCISLCFYLVYLLSQDRSCFEPTSLCDVVSRIVENRFNFIGVVEIANQGRKNFQYEGSSSKMFLRNLLKDIEISFNLALKREIMLECVNLNELYISFLLGSGDRKAVRIL
jgi:hypothetical protein